MRVPTQEYFSKKKNIFFIGEYLPTISFFCVFCPAPIQAPIVNTIGVQKYNRRKITIYIGMYILIISDGEITDGDGCRSSLESKDERKKK